MKDILPLNPVLDLDVGYVFKMSDIVCDNSQPLAEGMTGNDHMFTDDGRIIVHKFYEYVSVEQILLILHRTCNLSGEGRKYGCRGAFSSYRQRSYRCREVKPEIPAAILRRFYAAWHSPALLAQPNVLPATDGCLDLARSASEEYFLKTMMYSYATI